MSEETGDGGVSTLKVSPPQSALVRAASLLNVTGAAAGGVAAVCACDAAFDASMADSLVAGWLTEVGLQAVIGTFREVSPCCSLTLGSDLLTITHRKSAH